MGSVPACAPCVFLLPVAAMIMRLKSPGSIAFGISLIANGDSSWFGNGDCGRSGNGGPRQVGQRGQR